MLFSHPPQLLDQFPQLSVTTLSVTGVTSAPDVAHTTRPFLERATARLAQRPESKFPEIAAWRRAFSQMGLKPTSEALLRRFRKDGSLPSIHPLVDVCNAVSLAYAIPIAVFDLDQVTGNLTVRHATGTETYATFAGDTETPEAGEVIFADDAGHAHARRWTNRQSGRSAIRPETHVVLIVSVAMPDTGQYDVNALREELREALTLCWTVTT
jgi:DNA/RNA-binding domain of Phe-tRNA-synthetase-like protein